MADENIEKPKEKESSASEADRLFSQQTEIAPLRDVELEDEDLEEGEDEHGTLEERIEGSRKLTDFQVADKRLNPDLLFRHLNVIQMSRVFPDIYNPYFRIMLKDLVKTSGLSVAEAMAYVNTALSIAIDGEGRIDVIQIARGHIAQAEEEKNKGAGLP